MKQIVPVLLAALISGWAARPGSAAPATRTERFTHVREMGADAGLRALPQMRSAAVESPIDANPRATGMGSVFAWSRAPENLHDVGPDLAVVAHNEQKLSEEKLRRLSEQPAPDMSPYLTHLPKEKAAELLPWLMDRVKDSVARFAVGYAFADSEGRIVGDVVTEDLGALDPSGRATHPELQNGNSTLVTLKVRRDDLYIESLSFGANASVGSPSPLSDQGQANLIAARNRHNGEVLARPLPPNPFARPAVEPPSPVPAPAAPAAAPKSLESLETQLGVLNPS